MSRSHQGGDYRKQIEKINFFSMKQVDVKICGSALKFIKLIEGKADVYLRTTPFCDWDVAAGEALLNCFGAKITDLNGASLGCYPHPYFKIQSFWADIGLR